MCRHLIQICIFNVSNCTLTRAAGWNAEMLKCWNAERLQCWKDESTRTFVVLYEHAKLPIGGRSSFSLVFICHEFIMTCTLLQIETASYSCVLCEQGSNIDIGGDVCHCNCMTVQISMLMHVISKDLLVNWEICQFSIASTNHHFGRLPTIATETSNWTDLNNLLNVNRFNQARNHLF